MLLPSAKRAKLKSNEVCNAVYILYIYIYIYIYILNIYIKYIY